MLNQQRFQVRAIASIWSEHEHSVEITLFDLHARCHFTIPAARETILQAGHFSMTTPGQFQATINSQQGVDLTDALRTGASTDQSILYITPNGENTIVSSHGSAATATTAWAEAIVASAPAKSCVLMQSNLSLETTRAALSAARHKGLTTVLNPAPVHCDFKTLYPWVDVLVVNESEAMLLGRAEDPIASGQTLQREHENKTVVVTLGARGAISFPQAVR